MVILDTGGILTYEDLPTELLGYKTNALTILEKDKTIRKLEKELIESALKECNYVIKEAAKRLGMSPRQVSYRIKKYGIKLKR